MGTDEQQQDLRPLPKREECKHHETHPARIDLCALLYPVSAGACSHRQFLSYKEQLAAIEADRANWTIKLKHADIRKLRQLVERAKMRVDSDALSQAVKMLGLEVEIKHSWGNNTRC